MRACDDVRLRVMANRPVTFTLGITPGTALALFIQRGYGMRWKTLKVMAGSVFGAVLIQGCALTQSTVAAYDGPSQPQEKVATLLAAMGHKNSTYKTMATQVGDRKVGIFGEGGRRVQVLPGRHRIVVHCYSHVYTASPSITYEFKAGHFYELTCRDVGNGGYAAAGVVEYGTQDPSPTE